MADVGSQTQFQEDGLLKPFGDGSYVIERYVYDKGVQWLVYRIIGGRGTPSLLQTFDTRREAAEYIGRLRG